MERDRSFSYRLGRHREGKAKKGKGMRTSESPHSEGQVGPIWEGKK